MSELNGNMYQDRDSIIEDIETFKRKWNIDYFEVKPEPKAPTHEEIMSKYWETNNKGTWITPVGYWEGHYTVANTTFSSSVVNLPKSWFTGRDSAEIPPEAK